MPKIKPKNVTKFTRASVAYSNSQWERVAIDYARWLAARDNITLPNDYDTKPKVNWSRVYTRKRRLWNGELVDTPITESRIRSVSWGQTRERTSEHAYYSGGRWKSGNVDEFVPELTIEIPHWDHVPVVEQLS